jgi:GT2 family glycosyltransferase
MAFDTKAFWEVGGFDEKFEGVGDWSEPDLCCRLRAEGKRLYFSKEARLEHRPSQTGAYKKRLRKSNRLENYELFSRRWVKPCWQHSLHKFTLKTYINLKEKGWI